MAELLITGKTFRKDVVCSCHLPAAKVHVGQFRLLELPKLLFVVCSLLILLLIVVYASSC